MDVMLSKELIEAIGANPLKVYGIEEEKNYYSSQSIDLRKHNTASIKKLRELIEPFKKLKGGKAIQILSDIGIWLEAASKGASAVKCKNTKHFAALAHEYIQTLPKHWLYCKDTKHELWAAFYVERVVFHEKRQSRDGMIPARTQLDLYYLELDKLELSQINVEDFEVRGKTVPEVLIEHGYLPETPELLAQYEADKQRFVEHHDKIGRQFNVTGIGTTNLDGNPNSNRWGFSTLHMDRNGEPSRVVVDVRFESDESRSGDKHSINRDYWRSKSFLTADEAEEPDEIKPGDVQIPKSLRRGDAGDHERARRAPRDEAPHRNQLEVLLRVTGLRMNVLSGHQR